MLNSATAKVESPPVLLRRPRVRALDAGDLGQVAGIFRGVFRKRSEAGSQALERDLSACFLEHPHYEEATCSLVYERPTGEIGGFFGAMPLRVNFMGARDLGSVMSTWMVSDRARDARAGAMLAQAHFKRPHACMFVDTANNVALGFASSTRMAVLPSDSLQWVKPLSYLGYAVSSLGRRIPGRPLEALSNGAERTESFFRRVTGKAAEGFEADCAFRPVTSENFSLLFLELVQNYRLRPDWTAEFLQWMLSICGRRPNMGPLRLCEVIDRAGRPIGGYAFHITPMRRAMVLQIVANRGAEIHVLQALIEDARQQRCVAVCGAANRRLIESLFRIPNVFYRHTCTTAARTRQPEMMLAVHEGDALVGGLVGDSWLPLTSESYA